MTAALWFWAQRTRSTLSVATRQIPPGTSLFHKHLTYFERPRSRLRRPHSDYRVAGNHHV